MRGDEEPRYEDIERELIPTVQKEVQRRFCEIHDYLVASPTALPYRDSLMKLADIASVLSESRMDVAPDTAGEYLAQQLNKALAIHGYQILRSDGLNKLVDQYGTAILDVLGIK